MESLMSAHDRLDAREELIRRAAETMERFVENVRRVIHGKDEKILLATTALLCGGHILLEDVPGTGKTMLVRSMMRSIEGASFYRIQGTPDLRPTDITGLEIFNQKAQEFEIRKGPILQADGVLFDEINRAQPKTQSALLEAMEERQATIGLVTYPLKPLFFVAATQNPLEHQGTYPLPEAQRDRFFLEMSMGYPAFEDEVQIVRAERMEHPIATLRPVVELEAVLSAKAAVPLVRLDPILEEWIVRIVQETRDVARYRDDLFIGASVRGSEDLPQAARAWALLQGRDYVTPRDIEELLVPILGHRMFFTNDFRSRMREEGRERTLQDFFAKLIAACPLDSSRLS
jgi:MoxR-like ATPase